MIISDISKAIELFKNNALLAYPTETFYGLGTVIFDKDDNKIAKENPIIEKVFASKQRDLDKALPLIVRNNDKALEILDLDREVEENFIELTKLFWPASLSFCLKAKHTIPQIITANTGNIVLRQSPNKIVQEIMNNLNSPIISTSANLSGQAPVLLANEIPKALEVDAIIDFIHLEDAPRGGQASTIIELCPNKEFRILRKGAFEVNNIIQLGYKEII